MIEMAQSRKAVLRERHHHLGPFKGLAGGQLVHELLGTDPHDQAQLVVLVQLYLCKEIAAVHQGKAIASAMVLGGFPVAEDHKGVLLMAGGPADTADVVDMVGHGLALHLAFLAIAPRKAH